MRNLSRLDLYYSHKKKKTTKNHAVKTKIFSASTLERSEETSFCPLPYRSIHCCSSFPSHLAEEAPGCPCPPTPVHLSPAWFGRECWGWEGYASPCRLLCMLCSQGCLPCGPQASGLWRVEYHLLIYHGWWGMGKLYNWNAQKSQKKKKGKLRK